MDFQTLQANVQSAMGRTDVPSYVYTLTTAGLNRDLRILEMQAETTLAASAESVTLPDGCLEIVSMYIDSGGSRSPLTPVTEMSQAVGHDSSGRPAFYAFHNGEITLMPVPDGSYTLVVRYYARLSDLSADADTNDVLTNYPDLYLYAALTHAAVWAQDQEAAGVYNSAYEQAKRLVQQKDVQRRLGGPVIQRTAWSNF